MTVDENKPDFDSMSPEEMMNWMESLSKRQSGTDAAINPSNPAAAGTIPLQKRIRRLLTFGVTVLIVAVVGIIGYMCYVNANNLVHPASSPPGEIDFSEFGIETIEEVIFTSPDGLQLVGWYIPPAPDSDGASVLCLHGHGANRAQFLETAKFLVEDGYGMLMFDFRNHGDSEGNTTTMGYFEVGDAIAAYEFLIAQPGVNPERIAVFGISMGGGVAIQTTARLPEVRALITITAFTDMRTLAQDGVILRTGLPPSPFAEIVLLFTNVMSGSNQFEVAPLQDMEAVGERPFFMIHGTADATIPFSHAERLVEAAQGPTEFFVVEGGGHVDVISVAPVEYERRIRAFLGTYLRG